MGTELSSWMLLLLSRSLVKGVPDTVVLGRRGQRHKHPAPHLLQHSRQRTVRATCRGCCYSTVSRQVRQQPSLLMGIDVQTGFSTSLVTHAPMI